MGLLDLVTEPLRALVGEAQRTESDVAHHVPLGPTHELEAKLEDAVSAAHRAADSLERHVEVIGVLANSLGPLAEAVTKLTDQINELLAVTAPLAAAERDVSRLEHLFGRHRRGGAPPGPPPPTPPPGTGQTA